MNSMRFCVYMVIESLTLANLALQLIFLNYYLHDTVSTQGIYTIRWFFEEPSLRTDPLITLFPRLSNCDVSIMGPGTGVSQFNVLCVLAFNGLNEAMYLCIFAWLLVLFMLTGLGIALMFLVAVIPQFRVATAAIGLNNRSRKCVSKLLAKQGLGAWFELILLQKNESVLVIQEFLDSVTAED